MVLLYWECKLYILCAIIYIERFRLQMLLLKVVWLLLKVKQQELLATNNLHKISILIRILLIITWNIVSLREYTCLAWLMLFIRLYKFVPFASELQYQQLHQMANCRMNHGIASWSVRLTGNEMTKNL